MIMKLTCIAILVSGFVILLTGCKSASKQAEDVQKASASGDKLTVGKVQKEIRIGMSNSDVVAALGSPNIVTTDDQRRESWVYDKIATSVVSSQSGGGVFLLVLGAQGSTGVASTSQRTLTVIIKFDENQKVRDFAYHSSSF
jgi:outer membrane protein assembly factor BamE (lipoprotein component of BamABCDE complex)